jgi:hypothetical protein
MGCSPFFVVKCFKINDPDLSHRRIILFLIIEFKV